MYRTVSLVLTLIVGFTSFAHAQAEWPAAKPVTIIVPSSPGGGTDAYGRISRGLHLPHVFADAPLD